MLLPLIEPLLVLSVCLQHHQLILLHLAQIFELSVVLVLKSPFYFELLDWSCFVNNFDFQRAISFHFTLTFFKLFLTLLFFEDLSNRVFTVNQGGLRLLGFDSNCACCALRDDVDLASKGHCRLDTLLFSWGFGIWTRFSTLRWFVIIHFGNWFWASLLLFWILQIFKIYHFFAFFGLFGTLDTLFLRFAWLASCFHARFLCKVWLYFFVFYIFFLWRIFFFKLCSIPFVWQLGLAVNNRFGNFDF